MLLIICDCRDYSTNAKIEDDATAKTFGSAFTESRYAFFLDSVICWMTFDEINEFVFANSAVATAKYQ